MDFTNPAACLDLLQKLHPIDTARTHATLLQITEALQLASPAPNQHLEVLEAAREAIACSQNERARCYTSQALPPDSEENTILQQVLRLWQVLSRSYAQIARRDAAAGTLDDQRALLAQRRTHYAGMALLEYFRAKRAVPAGCWAEIMPVTHTPCMRGWTGCAYPTRSTKSGMRRAHSRPTSPSCSPTSPIPMAAVRVS